MKAALTPLERKFLRQTLENTRDADCVVLVGSVARRTRTSPMGDIDLLVLNGRTRKLLHPGIQTTVLTNRDFRERVREGDDFVQWALRFGVSLRGRCRWQELRQELLGKAPWPNPAVKQEHASRRLGRARELLEMGDADAAQEDLLYAAGHLARANLLALGIYPLSRPELVAQLEDAGMGELAVLLKQLSSEDELPAHEIENLFGQILKLATTGEKGPSAALCEGSPSAISGS